jgi:hypothetical protein
MSTNASTNSTSFCETIEDLENQIKAIQNCQNESKKPSKLWLLFWIVRATKVWEYNSQHDSFDEYIGICSKYGKSQAHNLANAGKTIYTLLKHPDFKNSKLPLPYKLDLSLKLAKHPPNEIFGLWRDYLEKSVEIPRVDPPHNARSNAGQIVNLRDALDLLESID